MSDESKECLDIPYDEVTDEMWAVRDGGVELEVGVQQAHLRAEIRVHAHDREVRCRLCELRVHAQPL